MTPFEREALHLLASISAATWATAVLIFVAEVAIVVAITLY